MKTSQFNIIIAFLAFITSNGCHNPWLGLFFSVLALISALMGLIASLLDNKPAPSAPRLKTESNRPAAKSAKTQDFRLQTSDFRL